MRQSCSVLCPLPPPGSSRKAAMADHCQQVHRIHPDSPIPRENSIQGFSDYTLLLATSLYTTTCTTCISTYRNITVENMSEKPFGNNPTHQNSNLQISAASTARLTLPLRKLYGMRLGLAGITLAWLGQAVTFINFTLCIVFIIVLLCVFSRCQSKVQL